MSEAATTPRPAAPGRLLAVAAGGAAVAVFCGVYGRIHDPTFETVMSLFFSSQIQLKVWFATVAMVLAAFQLFSAFAIYGKLGDRRWPKWFPEAHRLSGILAFIFSLPVAYHCLWSLGFAETDNRAIVHSIFGCAFYGAFAAKVLAVRSSGLPKNVLPLVGGLAFAALTVAWLTSSVWFLTSDPLKRSIF